MARSDSSKDSASDSSKKVAKAAKAGATPSANVGREQRSLGFPMAMAGVIVLGTALVAFAWQARDVDALTPTFGDHWHIPYGIYDCTADGFVEPFSDNGDPGSGIHTHQDATGLQGDGVVHLHPQSSTATGPNAQLARFMETVQGDFDGDDAITFPDRPAITEEGATCDGEPAILQIARFAPGGTEPIEVITENLEDYTFEVDFEQVVIALAPEGFDIPPPPQEAQQTAAEASPFVTQGLDSGLTDIFGEGDGLIGFNDDGVLVDGENNPILDDNGEEITEASLETDADGDTDADADADADADTEEDADADE